MGRQVAACCLAVWLGCGMACAAELRQDGEGKGAGEQKKAFIEMKWEGRWDEGELILGTVKMWFDTAQALYRMDVHMSVTRGEWRVENTTAGLLLGPDGCVSWESERETGKTGRPDRRGYKSVPGEEPNLEKAGKWAGLMMPQVDAAFGIKRLKAELIMEEAKSPLEEKDDLKWHELKRKGNDEKDKLFAALAGWRQSKVWLGTDPKTGWPMKYVTRKDDNDAEWILSVTKLDLRPDLKGVFDLPAEVKAKLEEKK